MKKLRAYKVFNPDWTCRRFKYKIGKTYKHEGEIALCESGFHACVNVADCFNYKSFDPDNKVAIVELRGNIVEGEDKCVASEIKIIKELSWIEMLSLVNIGNGNTGLRNSGNSNSGDWNSGYRNSGNRNSGYRNSGYRNSGDLNSGDLNSGDLNSGNRNSGNRNSGDSNSGYGNSGVFCNKQREDKIDMFNKPSDWTWSDWEDSLQYNLIYNLNITEWISWDNMTDKEKTQYPKAFVTDGYIKVYEYKEAWANLWKTLTIRQQQSFKELPNFDSEIFEYITGIKL